MSATRNLIASCAGLALISTALPAAAQFLPMDVITRVPADQIITGIHNAINLALPQLVIKNSAGPLGALGMSPSGTYLVSAPSDGVLRLWDLQNGVEASRLHGLTAAPGAVVVGDTRVAATQGNTIKVWSIASGREERTIAGTQPATAVAFGKDTILIGRADGSIAEVALADGRDLRIFPGHKGNVVAMATTRDGNTLVSGDANGTVYIWDLATGSGSGGGVIPGLTALAVAPDGSGFAAGQKTGEVTLWSRAGAQLGRSVKHSGPVTSVAYSSNGAVVASAGGEKAVRLSDVTKKAEIKGFEVHTDNVVSVAFEPRYGRLFSAGKDGIVRVTDVSADPPKSLLRLVSTSKGWAALDENGRFDGSLDAARDIAWNSKDGDVAIDRLSDRFNQPGLVPIMLASQPEKATVVASAAAPAPTKQQTELASRSIPPKQSTAKALSESIASAPKVALVEPKNGTTIDAESVEVAVQVTDGGGDVDEVRLYHNGRLVEDKGQRAAAITMRGGGKRVVQNFQIDLAPGENTIKAVAYSKARVESEPAVATVTAKVASAKPVVHVLAVGINEYKNPALNLNYGVSDAKGISEFFNRQKDLFGEVKVTEVLNAQATHDGILASMDVLKSTKPDDLVVVYLAGHGETDEEGNWYFVPHDLTYPEKQEQLRTIGISGQQLQKEIVKLGARKVVLLIDACKSGGAVVTMRGFEERKALRQLARASGVHVVAAAAQDQLAGEIVRLNHGVFTYAVLEALKGSADGAPKDGTVSVREMLSYIETRLPELSQEYRSKAQYPVVDSRGMDFPVASAQSN